MISKGLIHACGYLTYTINISGSPSGSPDPEYYVTPLGNNIEFVIDTGYTTPLGDNIELIILEVQ